MPLPLIPLAVALASELAPSLVKWLAGDDAGETAQKVVDVVTGVTGQTDDPLGAALVLPPEVRAQITLGLAKIEADREAARRQADLAEFKTEVEDRINARARDVAMMQTGRSNIRAHIMVGGAFLTLIACLAALVLSAWKTWALTGETIAIIMGISGTSGTLLGVAFSYEFGSSRGSAAKDATIASQARVIQNGH